MHVAINALCIVNRSGTGRYAWGLIDGLLAQPSPGWIYSILIPADFPLPESWRSNLNVRFYTIPIHSIYQRIAWEQGSLPVFLRVIKPDLLHSLAFIAPVLRRVRVKQVVTIHDLAFRQYPETIPWIRRRFYRWIIPRSWRKADAVIADSKSVAAELAILPDPPQAIVPVHLGVDLTRFSPQPADTDAPILDRYNLREPYVLFVGTREPRKNLPTVLRAYASARSNGFNPILAIAGRYGWMTERSQENPGVRWLDYVEEGHLPALYRNARSLIAPSLYEGFDLPAMEALACGTPVLASDIPVHHEVLGNSATFILPCDVSDWEKALIERATAKQAPANAPIRDWSQTARETRTVYEFMLQ